MPYIPLIARVLLGLAFVVFGLNFWLGFISMEPPEEGSQAAAFMGAIYTTGFLTVVKVIEVVCGTLMIIGRFLNISLILLSAVIVNIVLYHFLIQGADHLVGLVLAVLAMVVWASRIDLLKTVFKF